jgi:hypothetical protein
VSEILVESLSKDHLVAEPQVDSIEIVLKVNVVDGAVAKHQCIIRRVSVFAL